MRNELKNRQLNYDCDDIQISLHDDDGGKNPKISEVAHEKNWQLFVFLVCLRELFWSSWVGTTLNQRAEISHGELKLIKSANRLVAHEIIVRSNYHKS